MLIKHSINSTYQSDVDSIPGSTAYTSDMDICLDIALPVSVAVLSVVGLFTVATVTTVAPHNLISGANITMSGCTGTHPTYFNITTAITVTSPTTFTYAITSDSESMGGAPAYAINYLAATVSIPYASVVSMVLQSDVPCGIATNELPGSAPAAVINLAGSNVQGLPVIIPIASAAFVFASTNVTVLYLYNAAITSAAGTYNNSPAAAVGTLKIRGLIIA
jgi:hypothetical protein